MYPAFLRGRLYTGSINGPADKLVKSYLAGEPAGTFAFFQITKAATESSGMPGAAPTPMTMERAMGLAGGNPDFARLMMVQPDESQFGMMFVAADGLKTVRLKCAQVSLRFTTLDQLIEDMRLNNIPIDPSKMQYPGMAYAMTDDYYG